MSWKYKQLKHPFLSLHFCVTSILFGVCCVLLWLWPLTRTVSCLTTASIASLFDIWWENSRLWCCVCAVTGSTGSNKHSHTKINKWTGSRALLRALLWLSICCVFSFAHVATSTDQLESSRNRDQRFFFLLLKQQKNGFQSTKNKRFLQWLWLFRDHSSFYFAYHFSIGLSIVIIRLH